MWSGMVLFRVKLILDKNVYCNTQSTTKQDFYGKYNWCAKRK